MGVQQIERHFDIKVVGQVIAIPFDLWAISQGTPALKLRDDEAELMALPAKELLDYYLPQIPVIAWAWISLSIGMYAAMKPRLELIQILKKQKANTSSAKRPAPAPAAQASKPGAPASSVFPSEITTEKV